MLIIRFFRTGKKNQPFFKIVVTDKRKPPRGGKFVEQVGFYNPLTKEKNIKKERVKYWLLVGAKPSDTVHNFLISEKVIEEKKIPKHKISKKKEKESAPAPAPAETPSPVGALEGKPAGKEAAVGKEEKPAEEKSKEKTKEKKVEEVSKEKASEEKSKEASVEIKLQQTESKEKEKKEKPREEEKKEEKKEEREKTE